MCTSCNRSNECHCHSRDHNESKQNTKLFVISLLISSLIVIFAGFFEISTKFKIVLYIFAYILSGKDVIIQAFKNITKGKMLDENFLMTLATICAFAIGEFSEAVIVMILYKIGEFLQDKAVDKSKNEISKLIDLRQDYANILVNNEIKKISAKEVKKEDIIIVKKGEKIPLDGIIVQGSADIDTSAINGESIGEYVTVDNEVLSGYIVNDGYLKIKVKNEFENSTATKIIKLMKEAENKKSASEKFITKFARYYTPFVVFLAILLTVIPVFFLNGDFIFYFKKALTFLVISCPCALVISIPLGFFAGIGKASKKGILIKGSEFIEKLANVDSFVFDKTGTLTKGEFNIEKTVSLSSLSEDEILKIASILESFSNHPISKAFKNSNFNANSISEIKEETGNGISAKIENTTYFIGRKNFLIKNNIKVNETNEDSKVIYFADKNNVLGYIKLNDKLKDEAKDTIEKLRKSGKNIFILSGDNKSAVEKTSAELKVKNFYYNLMPKDKLKHLKEIISNKKKNKNVIYIGDGINDAPALKISDAAIAIGKNKTDIAVESSDIVIMNDNLCKISDAVEISKNTMKIVKENIFFSISTKVLFLILASLSIVAIQGAVFADVGVTLIAVLNSLRLLR